MALSALQRLRLQIADQPRRVVHEQIGTGDGFLTMFQAQLHPIVLNSETITLRVGAVETVQDSGTDYEIELDTGVVTFAITPTSGTMVFASYRWAVFTDTELEDLLGSFGDDVVRAAMRAIQWLLADTDRFIKYTFGQETVDRTAGRKGLLELYDTLRATVGAPTGLVKALSDDREALMAPFIEQGEELEDVSG